MTSTHVVDGRQDVGLRFRGQRFQPHKKRKRSLWSAANRTSDLQGLTRLVDHDIRSSQTKLCMNIEHIQFVFMAYRMRFFVPKQQHFLREIRSTLFLPKS